MTFRTTTQSRTNRLAVTLYQFADCWFVAGYLGLVLTLYSLPAFRESPVQPLFGLPLLLFLPGYALLAALFPGRAASDGAEEMNSGGTSPLPRQVDIIERAALSFGMSVAILPWFALGLGFTPGRFSLYSILKGLTVIIGAGIGIGALRRLRLPAPDRFYVPVFEWVEEARAAVFDAGSALDGVVNLVLFLSVIVALSSIAFGMVVPNHQSSFTNFYLATENESGELVASGYPTAFVDGESKPVVLGIDNREGREITYTVVVRLQRVMTSNGTAQVVEVRELDRFRITLAANRTWTDTYAITPTMQGDDLRLQFILYRGDAPEEVNRETAYRRLHLWIDVSSADQSDHRGGPPLGGCCS